MIVGTPESRELCLKVAQCTDTVLLGFSRGKDAIATVLWLKEFFPNIILFHKSGCPGVPFVERSLTYYEEQFGIKIERCYTSGLFNNIGSLLYQYIEDEDAINEMDLGRFIYEGDELATWLKAKYKAPHAWEAWGLSYKDNPMRAVRSNLRAGWIEEKHVFYPIFDWDKNTILSTIEGAGLKLPEDYLYAARSFHDIANTRHFDRMAEQAPEEWDAVRTIFPLIDAARARLAFRRMHFAEADAAAETETSTDTPEMVDAPETPSQ